MPLQFSKPNFQNQKKKKTRLKKNNEKYFQNVWAEKNNDEKFFCF